jgi:hypothetical protein
MKIWESSSSAALTVEYRRAAEAKDCREATPTLVALKLARASFNLQDDVRGPASAPQVAKPRDGAVVGCNRLLQGFQVVSEEGVRDNIRIWK